MIIMARLKRIRDERIKKLNKLRSLGIDPFPGKLSPPTISIGKLVENFDELIEKGERQNIVGRIMSIRQHGGVSFIDVEQEGKRMQIFFERRSLKGKEKSYDLFLELIDNGDFVGFLGNPFYTKKGEPSLKASDWQLLTKAVRPLPAKWHGLKDKEERFRRRYLDLLINKEARSRVLTRSKLVGLLRSFFIEKGFIEMDTPVLQSVAGGALAHPFETYLEALDMKLYLRIAPELYLKRLLVSGFGKVFELGKNFRNEGMDATHNPEFMMLEAYWAYHNYSDFMELTEELFDKLVHSLTGKNKISYNKQEIVFKKKWPRVEFEELLRQHCGIDFQSSAADLKKAAQRFNLIINKKMSKAAGYDALFKKVCRNKLYQPTFVIGHPRQLSPLAKADPEKDNRMERFQVIIAGMEMANGFTELNDPFDQAERFRDQVQLAKKGEEAHPYDQSFIDALEYGMPPATGVGYGVERIAALFTDSPTLREVIPFPLMRPKG